MKQRFLQQLSILLLLVLSIHVLANDPEEGNGIIKGKITTADGQPAAFVTIQFKGLKRTAVTGEDGTFAVRNLPAGTYELEISLAGYETTTKTVIVSDKETIAVSIALKLSEKELETVTITSGRRKFVRKSSDYVSRMPLKNLENPQAYSTISNELMKEQLIVSVDDALKNAPGIDKLWSSTGRGGDGAAYFTLRGFAVQPSMINGIAGLSNGGLDPANIERMEVIKGPSGTLFGSSLISFGGLINMVTKKPYDKLGGEISYTGGGFGLSRITADFNTPLGKDSNVLFRVNAAYHYENSWQDAGYKKSFYVTPSLIYKASDRLNFHFNAEFYNSESTNPLMVFLNRTRKLIATTPAELGIDWKRSFTADDITIKTPTMNLYGQMNYKISDQWTSQTIVSQSVRKSQGLYSYVMFLGATDTLLSRYVGAQNSTGTTLDIQQNFIGDFTILGMRNRLVAGLDFFSNKNNTNQAYALYDLVNSVRTDDVRYGQISKSAVEAKIALITPTKNITTQYTYSAYASNVLNVTNRLLAMVSLRVDRFDNKGSYNVSNSKTTGAYAQTAFSPKFGLVYSVIKDRLSVFGNYMNGFKNVAAATQPDGSVSHFKPQQANQWEAGVKMELFGGKLTGTLSYYDIFVTNITRPDPDKAGYTIQDGNVYSRGIEADIIANPLPGLNVIAGYAYNDSKNDQTDKTTIGLRPVSAGPQNLANGWISYTLLNGDLKGLGLGVGGNYASENKITNNTTNGVFAIPAYTVFNASLFYNARSFRVGLKVDNLTDKKYFKGWTTVEPMMPRRVSANVSFRF